jgi:hypothetical protein
MAQSQMGGTNEAALAGPYLEAESRQVTCGTQKPMQVTTAFQDL